MWTLLYLVGFVTLVTLMNFTVGMNQTYLVGFVTLVTLMNFTVNMNQTYLVGFVTLVTLMNFTVSGMNQAYLVGFATLVTLMNFTVSMNQTYLVGFATLVTLMNFTVSMNQTYLVGFVTLVTLMNFTVGMDRWNVLLHLSHFCERLSAYHAQKGFLACTKKKGLIVHSFYFKTVWRTNRRKAAFIKLCSHLTFAFAFASTLPSSLTLHQWKRKHKRTEWVWTHSWHFPLTQL